MLSAALDLARGHLHAGRLAEAEAGCRRVLAAEPEQPDALVLLGVVALAVGRHPLALDLVRRAIAVKPTEASYYNNLGVILQHRGELEPAVEAWHEAVRLRPDYPEALNNLGNTLAELSRPEESLGAYRRAVALRPEDAALHSNMVYSLAFHPACDAAALRRELALWNERHAIPLRPQRPAHAPDPDPERRLRIGYVSQDFRQHAAAFFLVPLLEAHRHERFHIFCYSDVRRPDAITERLRACADAWHDTTHLSDEALASRITKDRIDILVDLTMHLEGNRLLAFARRPAPVQASWLAYPGSTGCETIDHQLTDALMAGGDGAVQLPDSWCCYQPVADFPPVGASSASKTGNITFGSLNKFSRVNDSVLRCWAAVLAAVSHSRLLLLCPPGRCRDRLREFFEARGVAAHRLELVSYCPWPEYVRHLQRIDIGLDSFPCNGMTTTCHTLWMGAPVIPRPGASPAARAGLSLLSTVGLTECIAPSEDDYVRIAAGLARDLPRLSEWRATLRARMQASPLMDAPRFARNVEAAYRQMWREWAAPAGA